MFRLHNDVTRLDIPVQRVLRLERSLGDVQVALPGLPAQHATAYLCGFSVGQGFRIAVVLHLHTSGQLAFYFNEEGTVPRRDGPRIYNEALGFARSMGFMFGDLDIHLKSHEERAALWRSLPLRSGVQAAPATTAAEALQAVPVAPAAAAGPAARSKSAKATGATPAKAAPPKPLTAVELAGKRRELRENLGRFLASL